MKTVKVCYSIRDNIGDSINPLIIEKVLGVKIEWADPLNCQTSGIGSGLSRYFINSKKRYTTYSGLKKAVGGIIHNNPLQIWSAGFISHNHQKESAIRRNTNVASVRGELSKKRLEKALGKKLDIPTGDGGLLAEMLLTEKSNKKYRLGIIPHIREIGEKKYNEIYDKHPKSIIIDVRTAPNEFLKLISKCECVISSSLHGLIISDSFYIPNQQVVLTNKLKGDGFKFEDYYSSFGLTAKALDLNTVNEINIDEIISSYQISEAMTDRKKEEIATSFFKYI